MDTKLMCEQIGRLLIRDEMFRGEIIKYVIVGKAVERAFALNMPLCEKIEDEYDDIFEDVIWDIDELTCWFMDNEKKRVDEYEKINALIPGVLKKVGK